MAKYGEKASEKVEKAMHERKKGTLKSGRSGKKVTSKKQAIAIGLSEARKAGGNVPKKKSSKKKIDLNLGWPIAANQTTHSWLCLQKSKSHQRQWLFLPISAAPIVLDLKYPPTAVSGIRNISVAIAW